MSKFLVELPESEEIHALIPDMASYADAEFRIISTLETENERLARAVAGLTGQILTAEDVITPGQPYIWGVDFSKGSDVGKTIQVRKQNGGMVLVNETIEPEPEPTTTTEKICEVCGEPAGPRGKTCGKEACRKESKKRYMAVYLAGKKKESLPDPSITEEREELLEVAPAATVPLAVVPDGDSTESESGSKWPLMTEYLVMSGPQKGNYLTIWEVMEKGQNGELEMGTFLQHKEGRRGRLARNGRVLVVQFDTELPEPVLPGAE